MEHINNIKNIVDKLWKWREENFLNDDDKIDEMYDEFLSLKRNILEILINVDLNNDNYIKIINELRKILNPISSDIEEYLQNIPTRELLLVSIPLYASMIRMLQFIIDNIKKNKG